LEGGVVTSSVDIIRHAQEQLDRAKAELAASQEQLRAAQQREENALARVREIQTVWDWLQVNGHEEEREEATSRHDEEVPEAASTETGPDVGQGQQTRFGRPVSEEANTDLCLRVLASFGRPASTKEVRDRLARDGHDLNTDQVRGSLKYLARKKEPQVETATGSGVWRFVSDEEIMANREIKKELSFS
jgi:hypothetical protein